jgi:hypothetical protein
MRKPPLWHELQPKSEPWGPLPDHQVRSNVQAPTFSIIQISVLENGKCLADPTQLGTAFFITSTGLFVTAKHVVEVHTEEAPFSIFLTSASPPGSVPDFFSAEQTQSFHQVIVSDLWLHPNLDAAIGFVRVPSMVPRYKIGTRILQPGEVVATHGYGRTQHAAYREDDGTKTLALNFRPGFYRGMIDEYLPQGRGHTKWPLYVHSATLLGGISGGPLICASDDAVYGINCTGIEGVEGYGSSTVIEPLLEWAIPFLEGRTIRNLASEFPDLVTLST